MLAGVVCIARAAVVGASAASAGSGSPVSIFTGTGIDNPEQIVTGPDGALWFTNENNSIRRITTAGVVTN